MKNVIILGSTGSIGVNTLDVVEQNIDSFNIYALVANSNVDLMTQQCLLFHPKYACMIDNKAATQLKKNLSLYLTKYNKIEILSGLDNACYLSSIGEVDIVVSAIVGIAGVRPTLSALHSGKRVLLANKESLVTCGQILIKVLQENNASLLPLDSEHNAIFQNLPESFQNNLGFCSIKDYGISRIVLTASGGPFFNIPFDKLVNITPEQACVHPNWVMGKKISVDCATMMNKGLEYIAARQLFHASTDQVEILLHPQSIIHSMVYYIDGSVLAHLAVPDIRVSIAHAMAWPKRMMIKTIPLDLLRLGKLVFCALDINQYPCLQLAITVSNISQSSIIILNAANEVAVTAFLCKKIRFTKISDIIKQVLDSLSITINPQSIEEVLYVDQIARRKANAIVNCCV